MSNQNLELGSLLATAFAKTDTISHGDFMISKKPGDSWKEAVAIVDGQKIELTSAQKKYLALLISQKGAPLTRDIFAENMSSLEQCVLYLATSDIQNTKQRQNAKQRMTSIMSTYAETLKTTLKKHGVNENTVDCIEIVNPRPSQKEMWKAEQGMSGAYKLLLPFPE